MGVRVIVACKYCGTEHYLDITQGKCPCCGANRYTILKIKNGGKDD